MTQENKAFERVQNARHPKRPYALDLLNAVFADFAELHGDRRFYDDQAIIAGLAKLENFDVAVIGQQKGRDTNQRRARNFGMPKPEGYRKALRIMKLAEKFARPIITFVDTPGAYPGVDAEERGQAEAIAYNLREMASLKVPIIVVIVGEGGSGGALAIAVGDRVLMMENAVYSVISPEGWAAILWKDATRAAVAAECLKLTADKLHSLGIVDEIIPENDVWDYNDIEEEKADSVTESLKKALVKNLKELKKKETEDLLTDRYAKFRHMGKWL